MFEKILKREKPQKQEPVPDFNAWGHDELLAQFPICHLCDQRRSFVVIAPKGKPPEARCFQCDVAARA